MRFYYVSLFSLIFLGVIYVVGTGLLLWFGSWLRKRMNKAWIVMAPLFALLYIGPVAEELWIAWNFGQLCRKDAGNFVYKTVEVEGFFSGTGATLELVRPGAYRFIEAYSSDRKGVVRLTFGDAEFKRQAVARYEKRFPGNSAAERDMIRVDMDERTEALVYPKKGDSWRIVRLDHPTARYHYTTNIYGSRVAHKVTRQESLVTDKTSEEVIGRYVEYGRGAPWFFNGLGKPSYSCDGPDGGPNSKYNRLIYKEVLKPIK